LLIFVVGNNKPWLAYNIETMTTEELETAIKRGRLPFSGRDYWALGFGTFIFILMITLLFINPVNNPFAIVPFSVIALISVAYRFRQNNLAVYTSNKSIASKEATLIQLFKGMNGERVKNDDNYFRFYITGGWFSNTYLIRIIYTDNAYYINSRYTESKGSFLYGTNVGKVQEIINKLKYE
jgi:hypothetical protein